MPHCCVPGCNHRSETKPQLSFYRFPVDPNQRKQWTERVRRADSGFHPDRARICSHHFPGGKSEGPTLFPWNEEKPFAFSSAEKTPKRKKKGTTLTSEQTEFNPLTVLADAALGEEKVPLGFSESPAARGLRADDVILETENNNMLLVGVNQLKEEVTQLKENKGTYNA